MFALLLGLAIQTGTAASQKSPPGPPKPTAAIQALLDQAAKLAVKGQLQILQRAAYLAYSTHDLSGEATTLDVLGSDWEEVSEHSKALDAFGLALPLFRLIRDWSGESKTLTGIGTVYAAQSQFAHALKVYREALAVYRKFGDRNGEADVLMRVGSVHEDLSEHSTAVKLFQLARQAYSQTGNWVGQADALDNIGNVYRFTFSDFAAYDSEQRALKVYRQLGDLSGEATTLCNLGFTYIDGLRFSEAIGFFRQALPIFRQIGHRNGEGMALEDIGAAYLRLRNYSAAIENYHLALPLSREVRNRSAEADILHGLAATFQAQGPAALGIAFGKQEINVLQSIRSDNKSLDKDSQTAFRESISDRYRGVAGWLTDAGRLAEAEEVLGLLKDDEFYRFLGERAGGGAQKLDLTPREAKWLAQYERLGGDLAEMGERRETLEKIAPSSLTPDQKAELSRLDKSVGSAEDAFQAFLAEAQNAFAEANISDDKRLDELGGADEIQKTLSSLPGHPVAIYTFSTGDTVRVIVTAPGGAPLARQAPDKISSDELNRKILAFRAVITDWRVDPRPLGAELYDLLVRPIEHDLASSKADVLMWNLDGALRYLPLAALYDDQRNQFLIEKYPSSIFTPHTVDRLTELPKRGGAAAFGVSKGGKVNGVRLSDLPGVPGEIAAVKQALGGATYDLDDKFTIKAFTDAMHDRPRIVHIATHFHFQPGHSEDSFLLLGSGQRWTISEIKKLPNDTFANVDTLTLSACETALGGDGGEFESFALLAQQKGASAVVASLWSVSDESTAILMGEFYRLRKAHPEWTKIAALREAQLAMLHGRLVGVPAAGTRSAFDIESPGKSDAPLWPKDRPRFSHPYYWAPFVLTGNWK